jgi:hypothetical protein
VTAETITTTAGAEGSVTEQVQQAEQQAEQQTDRAPVPPEVEKALRKANKEAETLRLRLKEYEDRDKTEQQRLDERLVAAEKAAAERETALLRYRVGVAKGLPPDLVERLRGSTEEELAADADSLLKILPPPRVTRGAVEQGPRSDAPPEASINDLLRAARGR